jgi:3-deoxy-D-manno-octulosonic-acid transferase
VPLVVLRLFFLSLRHPSYRARWQERFGYCLPLRGNNRAIWIHAVSVGEARAAKPLIESLSTEYPDASLLITTVTPAGAETVRQLFGNMILHRYLPYDLPGAVARFVETIHPCCLIVMETELWPNLFHYCHANDIPIVLANARLSERSARGYRRLATLTQATLKTIAHIAAQGEMDAVRFIISATEKQK